MAATDGQTTADDRMDAAGWWQLGGMAVLGAAVPFVAVPGGSGAYPWSAVLILSLVLVVVVPVAQLRTWWSRGGRAAVLATRGWVRAGRVPDEVPDEVWRPRVRQYVGDESRRIIGAYLAAALAVGWAVLGATGTPTGWAFAALWAVLAVGQAVQARERRAAGARLLATPARPEAGPSTMGA